MGFLDFAKALSDGAVTAVEAKRTRRRQVLSDHLAEQELEEKRRRTQLDAEQAAAKLKLDADQTAAKVTADLADKQAAAQARKGAAFASWRGDLAGQVKAGTVLPAAANDSLRAAATASGVNPGPAFQKAPPGAEHAQGLKQDANGRWFTPSEGMVTARPEPLPMMMPVTNADGSVTYTPIVKGGPPIQAKPIPMPKVRTLVDLSKEADELFQVDPMTKLPKPGSKQKREKYMREEAAKDAALLDAWKKANAGAPANPSAPRDGGGGPARGIYNVVPPTKYEDVALLPAWEQNARTALRLAPGTTVSSRARSQERNTAAGGAGGSWHTHRQAFDLVNANATQKAALKAWATSTGLHMIDEGDHLHFQPKEAT